MRHVFSWGVLAAVVAGCLSGYSDSPLSRTLRVRRGAFASDIVLSGELEAARGDFLNVPPLPSWQTAIKWIAEDGASVNGGDPVVELDNSALTADLESKRQTATQAIQELQQRDAEWTADVEQKALELEKRKSDLEKAKIEARLPRELLSGRAYEEKQTGFRRATNEFEKARDVLALRRTAIEAERRNLMLRIEKAKRQIATAEQAITALVLRAPRAGIVVVRDHPWEGRKLQTGDAVWVGFPIAMLPDLGSMRVKATLPDVDDRKIAAGMPATVTLDGYPSIAFGGRIAAISAVAQESRRQSLRRHFDVIVTLGRIDGDRMRPGLSARVVVRRETHPSVLLAPRATIDFAGRTPRIRLAGGVMKEVSLGSCNAQDCVVRNGVEEGERVEPLIEVRGG